MRPRKAFSIIFAGALAVMATACAPEFKPDTSTPNAAVRTFLGHLSRGDAAYAYALLGTEAQERCGRDTFQNREPFWQQELERSRVVVRETIVRDSKATVLATVDPGRVDVGIFGVHRSSFDTTFTLVRDGAGWRINELGWPWGYCDYSKTPPPDAPVPAEPPRSGTAPAPVEATPGGGR